MMVSESPYIIRRARLSDAEQMAYVATEAYRFSEFSDFLAPDRFEHWSSYIYGFFERFRLRLLLPNAVAYVAVDAHKPSRVAGLAVFTREGSDAHARELRRKQWSVMAWFFRSWYQFVAKFWKLAWTNKSDHPENLKLFVEYGQNMGKRVWSKYPERWHAQSVCVAPQAQRKGLGYILMRQMLEIAQKERVPIGLEASPEGEGMYRRVGFRLLERFENLSPGPVDIPPAGGIMLWEPEPDRAVEDGLVSGGAVPNGTG